MICSRIRTMNGDRGRQAQILKSETDLSLIFLKPSKHKEQIGVVMKTICNKLGVYSKKGRKRNLMLEQSETAVILIKGRH